MVPLRLAAQASIASLSLGKSSEGSARKRTPTLASLGPVRHDPRAVAASTLHVQFWSFRAEPERARVRTRPLVHLGQRSFSPAGVTGDRGAAAESRAPGLRVCVGSIADRDWRPGTAGVLAVWGASMHSLSTEIMHVAQFGGCAVCRSH